MNNKFYFYSLNCFAIGSGFYLTGVLPISPIYFLFLLGCICFLLGGRGNPLTALPRIPVGSVLLVATVHYFCYLVWVSPFNSGFGFYFNIIYLSCVWFVLNYSTRKIVFKVSWNVVLITIALAAVESIIRLSSSSGGNEIDDSSLRYYEETGTMFYKYKFNSMMYPDSNFVAAWVLVVTVFCIEIFGFNRNKVICLVLILVVALTFCRAAIGSLVIYLILRLVSIHKMNQLFRFGLISILLFVVAFFGYGLVSDDGSFQSKISLVKVSMENFFGRSIAETLLGNGISSSKDVLDGVSAHNIVFEIAIEAGVLGLLYIGYVLWMLARFAGPSGRRLLGVFIFSGLSFAPTTCPYLYAILAMMVYLRTGKPAVMSDISMLPKKMSV